MQLILDLGNTNQKVALFENDQLIEIRQFTKLSVSALKKMIAGHSGISHCILSSVISHSDELTDYISSHCKLLILDEFTPIPVKNNYKTPETLGKDRLAAAVGGHEIFPGQNVLVINAGTCITYDFVDKSGTYHGGAISPGMHMRLNALHTFTGKLPLVGYQPTSFLIGQTTEESILSGVIYGMTAEIEGIAENYRATYTDLNVILSGGDLNNFDKRLKISTFAVPNIVILGLQKILSFNVL